MPGMTRLVHVQSLGPADQKRDADAREHGEEQSRRDPEPGDGAHGTPAFLGGGFSLTGPTARLQGYLPAIQDRRQFKTRQGYKVKNADARRSLSHRRWRRARLINHSSYSGYRPAPVTDSA